MSTNSVSWLHVSGFVSFPSARWVELHWEISLVLYPLDLLILAPKLSAEDSLSVSLEGIREP